MKSACILYFIISYYITLYYISGWGWSSFKKRSRTSWWATHVHFKVWPRQTLKAVRF